MLVDDVNYILNYLGKNIKFEIEDYIWVCITSFFKNKFDIREYMWEISPYYDESLFQSLGDFLRYAEDCIGS